MRRLYLQIYLTLIGVLLLSTLIAWAGVHWVDGGWGNRKLYDGVAELMSDRLPPAGGDPAAVERELRTLEEALDVDASLYGPDRARIASTADPVEIPFDARPDASSSHGRVLVLRLPDQRWLALRFDRRGGSVFGPTWSLAALALGVALGAWPLARRLTRRLERLRGRVEALGSGDLRTRIEVEGRDEIADLARSFNRAAERIESLVASQRRMLATASHELRTPLARLRVAIELLEGDTRPDLRDRIAADIDELDELVGEILLSSRLDSGADLDRWEILDVAKLAREEAEAAGLECAVPADGEPAQVRGDARLLRRALRNLIENARRHSGDAPAEVAVAVADSRVLARVCDRGPGIPPDQRERIFEAFYRPPGSRETGQGWGLGLSLVRSIAHRHGGDVRCRDREGGGSCFELEMPGVDPGP